MSSAPATIHPVSAPPSPVLEVRGLSKAFHIEGARNRGRGTFLAVDDVSLSLWPGRATALVGESGSGKSTLVRLLVGLLAPDAGEILLDGHTLRRRRRRRDLADVQMVFQDPFSSLNPVHTIRYQLERPLRNHRDRIQDGSIDEALAHLLAGVQLRPADQYLHKYPQELSGGQRQRVAIARALAPRPRVLLADEPISMLDVSIRLDLLNLLDRLRETENLAMLYVTHDIATARYFAAETVVMYGGQLIEGGDSDSVTQHPAHPYTSLLIASAPEPRRRATSVAAVAPAPVADRALPAAGCRFAPRCPHVMAVCRERMPGPSELGGGHWVRCHLFGSGGGEGGKP